MRSRGQNQLPNPSASETSAAPGDLRRGERPPTASVAAPSPGAVARPAPSSDTTPTHPRPPQHPTTWDTTIARTARLRPLITPHIWHHQPPGPYPLTHPYIRRYWTAIVGPGAVADLLRLATAAQRGVSLVLPTHLDPLARADLIRHTGPTNTTGTIEVRTTLPPVPQHYLARLHPTLRRELAT